MIQLSQEEFNKLSEYEQYCVTYQDLLNCDDGSYQSQKAIELWINHTAFNLYGEEALDYYKRMMVELYGCDDEDFND